MRWNGMAGLLLAVVIGMAGCGSGGGDVNATPVGTVINLAQFKGVYTGTSTGAQYSFPAVSGSDSQGRAWTGSFTMIADGATIFESQSVSKRRSLVTLGLVNGASSSSTTTAYWQSSNDSVYKSITSTGVIYTPSAVFSFPATAKVGDSGVLPLLNGSDGTTIAGSWALNAGSNGASIIVFYVTMKSGATVTATETDSYYLDKNGVPTKIGIIVTTSGITVTLAGDKI